jgi:hypothetical protein
MRYGFKGLDNQGNATADNASEFFAQDGSALEMPIRHRDPRFCYHAALRICSAWSREDRRLYYVVDMPATSRRIP